MADYNAHTYYGKRCLKALGPEGYRWLVSDWKAFQVGLYGPDPLEFSGVAMRRAMDCHVTWREDILPRLNQAIRGDDPIGRSYGVGCLLHLILDEPVHEAIDRWSQEGSSHYRLEIALDELVLRKQNISPMPRLKCWHHPSVHQIFPDFSPAVFRVGNWAMAKVVDIFRWRGEALYRGVTPTEWDQAQQLLEILEGHVPQGVAALKELLPAGKA